MPTSLKAEAATKQKVMIYKMNYSDGTSSANTELQIANKVAKTLKETLEASGKYTVYTTDCVYAPTATTASKILNQMAQYDLIFFMCHGNNFKGGSIKIYKDFSLTYSNVKAWSGSLSKNKMIMAISCRAGNHDSGKSVIDAFVEKGAQSCVSFVDMCPASDNLVDFVKRLVRARFVASNGTNNLYMDFLNTFGHTSIPAIYSTYRQVRLDFKVDGHNTCLCPKVTGVEGY